MSDHHNILHFQNDAGDENIEVSTKEFMCIGATPPFDHPHIFIDMGADTQTLCPYCSTRYIYNENLLQGQANPEYALFSPIKEGE